MGPLTRIGARLVWPLVGMIGLGVFAEDQGVLHTNPFKRPLLELNGGNAAPAAAQAEQPAPLVLEATLVSPSGPLARISGQILGIGQAIDGYRLVSVRAGQVTLRKDGQNRVLQLESHSLSTRAGNE